MDNRRYSRNSNRTYRGAQYIDGNAVRKPSRQDASRRYEYNGRVVREVPGSARKNIKKRTTVNAGYIMFITVAMVVVGLFCMNYLTMTSDITNDLSKIASLETQLNKLKAENDDFDNRINGAVDLEEIKKRAMNDLGMQYAEDDQIVTYESDDTDYVRQYIALE